MVLLFLCQQFILLPCHLIMCCVNRVLLCCCSLWMMELSGLLTCVAVSLFIGITAQVYTLHLGLFSAGLTSADIFVFQALSNWPCQSMSHACGILYSLFILLCAFTHTQSYLLWPSAYFSSLSHSSYSTLCVSLSFVNLHCLLTVSGGLSAQHNFNLEDFVSSPRAPNTPANKIFCCFQPGLAFVALSSLLGG